MKGRDQVQVIMVTNIFTYKKKKKVSESNISGLAKVVKGDNCAEGLEFS